MANVKFSDLTAATSVASTDIFPVVASGASAATKATGTLVRQFVLGSSALANGQDFQIKSLTELTTIAASATTTTTIQVPAGARLLAVPVRVTTVIPTAATFTVSFNGTAMNTNGATGVSTAAGSTDPGLRAANIAALTAATGIVITPDMTPATNTGRVRVTIYYIEVTPPTS